MRKIAAILLVVLFLIPFANADGMMYVQDRDLWTLQSEQQQVAAIYYENGFENLLISINPGEDLKGARGIWIFPVPAAPDNVTIDVVKGFPYFEGDDIDRTYANTVTLASGILIGYATFPLSSLFVGIPFAVASVFGMAGNIQGGDFSYMPEVTVHRSIEKMGVTSELITTSDAAAFSRYFVQQGFTIPEPAQSSLDGYIGQDYSFVVVHISNITAYNLAKENTDGYYGSRYFGSWTPGMIGSSVRFPTDRIYYPLKPTRVYGDRQIPVLLYVVGHVTPGIYDDIESGTTVSYYIQDLYKIGEGLDTFFNGKKSITTLEYTKIRIETPSHDFSEDLWIDTDQPLGLTLKKLFIGLYVVFGVLFYLLFSMAASLLAGMLWLRENPVPKRKLLLHGLWNCLTMIGFVYGTRKVFDQTLYHNRRLFVLSFYLLFAGFVTLSTLVLYPSAIGYIPLYLALVIFGPFYLLGPVIGIGLFIILGLIIWKIYLFLGT